MNSVLLGRITKGTEPRPGSIHELESVIERSFVASPGTAFSLPEPLRSFPRLPPSVRAARREETDRGRIEHTDELAEALYEAGCDDGSVWSASGDVQKAGSTVVQVTIEEGPLAALASMA
jgi:hypothetical protein